MKRSLRRKRVSADIKVFHANDSALYFEGKGKRILVDGIYGGDIRNGGTVRDLGMSNMPREYFRMMIRGSGILSDPDILLFTHDHADHFNRDMTSEYMSSHRRTRIFLPEDGISDIMPVRKDDRYWEANEEGLRIGILSADHLDLTKDKSMYSGVVSRSYILDFRGRRFMVSGDSVLDESLLRVMEKNDAGSIDCIFVNVIHLLIREHIDFLKALRPGRVVLYHLPEPEDDTAGYLRLADRAAERYSRHMPPLIRAEHMAWLTEALK